MLAVKQDSTDSKKQSIVLLPNQRILEIEDDYLGIEQVYQVGNADAILVSHNCNGSTCATPQLAFITLRANGTHSITEWIASDNSEVKPIQVGEKLIVDLGWSEGKQQFVEYDNGKLAFQQRIANSSEVSDAKTKTCRWLYQSLYVPHVEHGRCDDSPGEVSGMSTMRTYNTLNEQEFNRSLFEAVSRTACKSKRAVNFEQFQQQICGK